MFSTKTAIFSRERTTCPRPSTATPADEHLRGHLERRRFLAAPPLSLQSHRRAGCAGAEVILNISASPWNVGKEKLRQDMLASLARKSRRPVLLCNMAGGNDELIFDGSSMAFNAEGGLIARARSFEEDFVVVDTAAAASSAPGAGGGGEHLQGARAGAAGLHAEMRVQIGRARIERRNRLGAGRLPGGGGAGREKCAGRFPAVAVFVAGQPGGRAPAGRAAGHRLRCHSHRAALRLGAEQLQAGVPRPGRKTRRRKTSRRGCAG